MNEIDRLQEVLALDFNHPELSELDRFANQVANIFGVPICLVSIITEQRQRWIAACGLNADVKKEGSPRDQSFCTHAVAARAALVVQDTKENPLFQNNPLVQSMGIRFYAGVPLMTRKYDALGTLCLLDQQPHTFTYFDVELLGVLAKRVMGVFEHWERERNSAEPEVAFRYLDHFDPELRIMGRPNLIDAIDVLACRAAERRQPLSLVGVAAEPEAFARLVPELRRAFPSHVIGRLAHNAIALVAIDISAREAKARAQAALKGAATIQACDIAMFPTAWMDSMRTVEQGLAG